MVELTATIDGAATRAFNDALRHLAEKLGDGAASAPRRAAINACKKFRAATMEAKKAKPMDAERSSVSPKWITYKDGRKLDRPLRRWSVTLKDRGLSFERFVYAGMKPEERAQVRALAGTNYYNLADSRSPNKAGGRRGLAKRSWGWVMHNIFVGSAPNAPWAMGRRDKRNPKDAAKDSYSSERRGAFGGSGVARICNRIDYIADALKRSVDDVLTRTANSIVRPIIDARLRRGGMSSDEIKSVGHSVFEAWRRDLSQ